MEATKQYPLPDPLAPFTTKLTDAYGLSIARIISADWFAGGFARTGGCEFLTRRDYVRNKRLFVRGEHDAGYFKQQLSKGDNDLEFINLDWSNINWAEKFCRIVSNGLNDKNYKLDVRATDKLSAIKKGKQQDFYLKYMQSKRMLDKAKKTLGIDMMPKTTIPQDEEEMQLVMEIKERPKIEIAEEILIDYILKTNSWEFLSGQYDKDIVDVGLMVARVYLDKNDGVKVAYVDSENYIHSKVKFNDFSDKKYEGVVDTISISDVKREWPEVTDIQLREIAKSYSTYNSVNRGFDFTTCAIDEILDHRVDVLRFAYKTSKTIVHKKKLRNGETVKLSKRPDTYEAPNRSDVGKLSRTLDTWLEGHYIVGTNMIYGWQECENLYSDVMNKALSPFITMAYDIYENRLRSFTDNIEAPVRQLQKFHLQIQRLCAELKPDIIEIDLDMLANLDEGKEGNKKEDTWVTALKLLTQKGVVFTKRIDMGENGQKDKPGARPMPSQQGSGIEVLLNAWAHYYNLIRENTGVNPARDGSLPADALVGVNQLAQLASNTVTQNIVEASRQFKTKICEVISTRIHSIFRYKDAAEIKEVYENVVGKQMLDSLEVLKDRHLHEFGFTFEMIPTSEEIKEFNDLLTLAVQRDNLDTEVVFQAKQLAKVNFKKAIEYLLYHRRRKLQLAAETEERNAKIKSQNDIASAQAAKQAELQLYQAKKQIDLTYEGQIAKIELMKQQGLQEIQQPVKDKEFQQQVYLEQIDAQVSLRKEEFKETRKDERTAIQATQQSKILKQRNTDGEPIDFEEEENWFMSPQQ